MNQNYFTKVIAIFIALFSFTTGAQNSDRFWTEFDAVTAKTTEQHPRKIKLVKEKFFQLNLEGLRSTLLNVGDRNQSRNTIISFPNSEGKLNKFEVFEASIMTPELQAEYPNMRTYAGQGIDNPSETIRFSITPKGLHAMFLGTENGTQFIDPFSVEGNVYTVYAKRDLEARDFEFECGVIDDPLLDRNLDENLLARNAQDGVLRDYRIAIAATVEYTAYHGGTVAGAMAAMVVTMTRVNGIYERDLSVTMTMVPNSSIIFTAEPDNLDNNNAGLLINQSQSVIDSNIGNANYDIGHTFSTGGGGLAGLGVTCAFGNKARGITGSPAPEGDAYDIDFVAHELGHQFGSPHTFNGNQGNCSGGNRSAADAYEPGSGSTIMAYAGICGSDNVQSNSDAYFHQRSLVRMWNHITSTGACPINRSNTGNTEPTANAGANFTIPQGTPYKLDGSASSDPDGNGSLTYTWEQYDVGLVSGVPTETTSTGPLVRSFEGTTNPVRYVPRLQDLKSTGGSTTWEKLVTVNRTINYRLTVRDNDASGGQTDFDTKTATVTTAAGPFVVTSQTTNGQSWDVGTTQTVTWNVAGTTGNSVNEANVNILLATDGENYDTVLATNVPNDGSHDIVVPNVSSVNCRVMVQAANGIFFNINTEDIAIGATETCTVYSSGAVNAAIEDGTGTTSPANGPPLVRTLNVPDSYTIESIKFSVDITHTYVGDLLVRLIHPNGTTEVNTWIGNCGSVDNIVVEFEDGAPAIDCGLTGIGATYAPAEALSAFNGLDSQGDWTILIADFFAGDTGTLNNWSVELCTTSGLSIEENELDNLSIYPNPNNGEFNIGFNPKSGEDITIEVYDIRGRNIYTNSFNTVSRFEEVIRLNNAQSGVYLLSISDGPQKVTKKIVID